MRDIPSTLIFAWLHFALLLSVIVVVLTLLAVRRDGEPAQLRRAVFAALPFLGIGLLSTLLLRAQGTPIMEWLIPGLGIMLVGLTGLSDSSFRWWRWSFLLLTLLLCANFFQLTTNDYTVAPQFTESFSANNESVARKRAAKALRENYSAEAHLAPAPLDNLLKPARKLGKIQRTAVQKEGHTLLTRLHRIKRRPARLWYPGGPVGENADQVEIRPAP